MGWCNDINNKKKYNKLVKISKNIKYEKMYRYDNKYDLVLPIKYNFHQPKLGKGSAIFLHLTKNYKNTAGCIALSKKRLFDFAQTYKKKYKYYNKLILSLPKNFRSNSYKSRTILSS